MALTSRLFPSFPISGPGPGRVELYPDTDDEMQWPPTAAYLPPRQCPATEFLESLMCAWVEISTGRFLDLLNIEE
jgi:hypothetical protein